jgi:uncharacterized tellurite resistance protein B-like protein
MLKALSDWMDQAFGQQDEPSSPENREHALRVATALLLVEVARADLAHDLTEDQTVFDLLRAHFELTESETRLLIEEAHQEADHAVELQAFTRRLHEAVDGREKERIVEMLWRVALADRQLDKHEDHLVRRVADLLYVPHGDVIRIRNRVHSPRL